MSKRDFLVGQYQFEPCAGCWDEIKEPKGHAHHAEVRRLPGKDLQDLLWTPLNIVVLHQQCHVPETEDLRFNSALILSVRAYREQGGGPGTIIRWVTTLPTKITLPPSDALVKVLAMWNHQSGMPCPQCHEYSLHFRNPRRAWDFVTEYKSAAKLVCWRCLWRNGAPSR